MIGKIAPFHHAKAVETTGFRTFVDDADDIDNPRGIFHRPRAQRDGVEHREEAGIETNCDAESDERCEREARLTPHGPYSMRQVLPQAFEPRYDAYAACIFWSPGL